MSSADTNGEGIQLTCPECSARLTFRFLKLGEMGVCRVCSAEIMVSDKTHPAYSASKDPLEESSNLPAARILNLMFGALLFYLFSFSLVSDYAEIQTIMIGSFLMIPALLATRKFGSPFLAYGSSMVSGINFLTRAATMLGMQIEYAFMMDIELLLIYLVVIRLKSAQVPGKQSTVLLVLCKYLLVANLIMSFLMFLITPLYSAVLSFLYDNDRLAFLVAWLGPLIPYVLLHIIGLTALIVVIRNARKTILLHSH